MSIKKPSNKTGPRFSKAEAMDILSEVVAIRIALDELEEIATDILKTPDLKLIRTEH